MRRKVLKIGPASLVVSIPSKWERKNNIKKGDELEVDELDKELRLSLERKKEEKKIVTLSLKSSELFMNRQISTLYIQGYDEIKVNFEDSGVLEKIESVVNQLIGYEIVSIDKSSLTIKNISSELDEELDTIQRRIFHITKIMGDRCKEYIENKNENDLRKNFETDSPSEVL